MRVYEVAKKLFEYDAVGNRKKLKVERGTYKDYEISYYYDKVNRLRHIHDPDATVTTMFYDANSNVKWKRYPNGTRADYEYDIANRTRGIRHTTGDGVFGRYGYEYDNVNNRRWVDRLDGREAYSYDQLYRRECDGYGL